GARSNLAIQRPGRYRSRARRDDENFGAAADQSESAATARDEIALRSHRPEPADRFGIPFLCSTELGLLFRDSPAGCGLQGRRPVADRADRSRRGWKTFAVTGEIDAAPHSDHLADEPSRGGG